MAWNKDFPANNTKIRLDPAGVRANWDAIETGGVPYDFLKLQLQGADHARETGYGWLYTKAGGSGRSELFYMDDRDPALVTRLTRDGGIGFFGQTLYGDEIILNDTSEFAYTRDAMISAAGRVSSSGTIQSGAFNIDSAQKNSTGDYTVFFDEDMSSSSNWTVVCNIITSGGNSERTCVVYEQETDRFSVRNFNSSGSLSDAGFGFVVIGGRPGE